jgi:hypothetical protein
MGPGTPAARRPAHRLPVNIAHLDDAPRGARIADRATTLRILERLPASG